MLLVSDIKYLLRFEKVRFLNIRVSTPIIEVSKEWSGNVLKIILKVVTKKKCNEEISEITKQISASSDFFSFSN